MTDKPLTEAQKRRLTQIPIKMKGTYLKAVQGSKAAALKAMCQECAGYQRSEIANCTAEACPLWPHRPYQTGE